MHPAFLHRCGTRLAAGIAAVSLFLLSGCQVRPPGSIETKFMQGAKRHLTIGGEVSTAGAISGDQSQRTGTASNAFTSHHRDTVFSGTAKIGVSIGGRVRAAAVGGAGGAWRRTSREGTTASLFPPASRAPFSETVTNLVFAYTLGGDVTFKLTDRLAILVAGRRHQLHDKDRLDTGVVARGVSSTIYRGGLGAQWRF